MENNQFVKKFYKNYSFTLLFSVFIIVAIATISIVLAYSPYYTHPDLTEEIAKLWNLKNDNQNLEISQNEIQWMRDGAINEDTPVRWINHFYDPINNTGWQGKHFGNLTPEEGLYEGESMAPKPAIASINWVVNQEYQSSYGRQYGNQTWPKAIKAYIDGDKKSAFIALGHILHLIEDASVPDYTRNDTHADLYGDPGSPYEKYSKEYTNFNKLNIAKNLKSKELLSLSAIQDAFNYLANYSNNNFFSEDTISNKDFELPNLDRLESKIENINNEKTLFLYNKQKQIYLVVLKDDEKYSTNDKSFILPSYFNNLAPQAVLTGASVINLFFQEVEKYKNNPPEILPDSNEAPLSYLKKSLRLALVNLDDIRDRVTTDSQIYLAQIDGFFSNIFSNQNFQSVGEISLNQTSGVQPQVANQISQQSASQASIKQCSFATSQSPSRLKIIINEVAWMGGVNSANDEWIELKNISGGKLNLNGYQLIDKAEQIRIVFNNNDKILAGGFDLLERMDDNSAPGISADKIYSGALANSNEGLRLFDGNCNLIDEVFANSSWSAGDNETKKTAERGGDFTWHTSAAIGGTPKKENSAPIVNKTKQLFQLEEDNEVVSILTATSAIQQITQQATSSQRQTQQTQQANNFKQCVFQTGQSPSRQKVIFNEVAWMGGLSDFGLMATDEWIELKNISNNEVDLSGWQILDKSENIKIVFDGAAKIPASGLELLERTDDGSVPDVAADKIYSGTLNNSDEGLRLFDGQCNLMDEVLAAPNWPAGDNGQKRTMERKPDFSWHTYNGIVQNNIFGTPKKENSAPSIVVYGGGGGTANNQQQIIDSTGSPAKILINEIQTYPTSSRFIELYNPNDFSINLTDWYIQRKTQTGDSFGSLVSKTYFEGKSIGAKSYFLISRESLEKVDIILNNLTLTKGNAIQIKNKNGDVIDKVGWGNSGDCESGCAPEPPESQSVQRKFQDNAFTDVDNNALDFEIQTCSSPRGQSKICQSAELNEAPGASFNNVVIGEIRAGVFGDANNEFVELYNPSDSSISLDGWSLKRKTSQNSTSTENLVSNFGASSTIAGKSFFLVAHKDYTGSAAADLIYTNNSNHLAYDDDVVILENAQNEIIDEVAYSEIPTGKSLERKANASSTADSINYGGDKFLGNGFDSGDSGADFVLRDASEPQNFLNPEPRSVPTAPQNFITTISSINWSPPVFLQ